MDLWIRFHIWSGGSPLKVGYMETYTLEKLKDIADIATRDRLLDRLEEKFKDCSQVFLPICGAGHLKIHQNHGSTATFLKHSLTSMLSLQSF